MNEEKFMKMVKWLTAGILLLVAFVVGVVIFIIYSFTAKDAASIGVIGGAVGFVISKLKR